MYYKLSGLTQRLTGATAWSAYSPQGLKPSVPGDAPPIVFATPTKVSSLTRAEVDYLGRNRVNDLQKLFQASDGSPVHLKRGIPDKLLYRTTMALTIGGTLYCLMALYFAVQPQNK